MIARDETGEVCVYGIKALLTEETAGFPEAWTGFLKTGKEASSDPEASVQVRLGQRAHQNTCMEGDRMCSLLVIVKALYVTLIKRKVIRKF